MEEDIPYGWAGHVWVNASFEETVEWCRSSMEKHNYDIVTYDTNLCLVVIRKPNDLITATLKWA